MALAKAVPTVLCGLMTLGLLRITAAERDLNIKFGKLEVADEQDVMTSKQETSNANECSAISEYVRNMAAAGVPDWQGVFKCVLRGAIVVIECGIETQGLRQGTPQCWVKERPDELAQLWHQFAHGADAALQAFMSLMPAGPSTADVDAAIRDFASGDATAAAELHAHIDGRSPFEKEFAVAVLKSATALPGSSLMQVSFDQGAKNWFTAILEVIAALFKNSQMNQRRAAANRYMSMNIGWDHVWANMRRDGYRF
eukprot:TRINITY_DN2103_c0_g1_i3.p1 TRINITY_DN2103_c0_g1~~TRINITY_DN2103_c0_g1_i3.p1  ORF type:complete len:255 (-),score=40.44 TRINITY_DN2103_c0_g1_i3:214-978(-)